MKRIKRKYRKYVFIVPFLRRKTPKFLILHRVKNWKGWEFPKGGLKEGEDELDCLKREIKEEFQNKIKIEKFRFLTEYKVESKKIWFYVYLIEKWKGNFPRYSVKTEKSLLI